MVKSEIGQNRISPSIPFYPTHNSRSILALNLSAVRSFSTLNTDFNLRIKVLHMFARLLDDLLFLKLVGMGGGGRISAFF